MSRRSVPAIEPLAAAGKLGALLAQFPSRFHDTPEGREYLAWLLRTFTGYPLAVELRHRSWSDAAETTMNNHFAEQAVANPTMVREMLDEPVTARMPTELVEAYPVLEGRVATLPRARLL